MIKQKLVSAKNIVVSHKTEILGTTVAVLAAAVVTQRIGLKQHNDFLKENDLYDTYYSVEEN
jgi:hypothetical protein